MTRFRLVYLAVLLAVMSLGLTFVSALRAQSKSNTASLSGAVTDPSGARVAKATVKLSNPEVAITRIDTSGPTGEFSFAFLPEGTYTLEASAPGFKTTRQTGIVLAAGDSLNLEMKLIVGTIEQVSVNATATLDSAVNTQGFRQLLGGGGSEDTADQDYSFLNFGGGYFGTNLFLLEGGYDVAQGWGGSQYVPAPEDTDQVKVTS